MLSLLRFPAILFYLELLKSFIQDHLFLQDVFPNLCFSKLTKLNVLVLYLCSQLPGTKRNYFLFFVR